eukprot:scaffold7712_cov119-Isochrysis_galbana.AAC.10
METRWVLGGKPPAACYMLFFSARRKELPLNPGVVPHRHAPSRLGIEGEKVVDKEVATMEKNGIIRKSNSAWASRVVLVTKKDGTVRFCTDYRDLNSKLQREDSPLPLTAEAIDRLSSGQGSRDSLFLSVRARLT